MKRPGLVLGSLRWMTLGSVAAVWLLPVKAQEVPANAPAATTPASGAAPAGAAPQGSPVQGAATPAAVTPVGATPAAGNGNGLSDKEKALLQKLNALKSPRWRSFGACQYDWAAWKLFADGVRITSVQCGTPPAAGKEKESPVARPSDSVAVHCDSLKLNLRSADQAWSGWRLPYSAAESTARGGEDLMVVALCANSKPVPKPQPSSPPVVTPAEKPATKAPVKPTPKPASKPAPASTKSAPATKR